MLSLDQEWSNSTTSLAVLQPTFLKIFWTSWVLLKVSSQWSAHSEPITKSLNRITAIPYQASWKWLKNSTIRVWGTRWHFEWNKICPQSAHKLLQALYCKHFFYPVIYLFLHLFIFMCLMCRDSAKTTEEWQLLGKDLSCWCCYDWNLNIIEK